MSGISAIGAYIPMYRLPREAFKQAWGTGGAGERSVASYDEDTTTMAVGAALDALNAGSREGVDAVFFGSTTPAYAEKQTASMIAVACDLPAGVRTVDFGGSLRAGTNALLAALDAVQAGSSRKALVVAAETRKGYPRSDFEQNLGDAAAAVMVTKSGAAVEVVESVSMSHEIVDVWRLDKDRFVRSWEDRFNITEGYEYAVKAGVKELLKKAKLTPAEISKAVVYGPDARNHAALVRSLGFDPAKQVQDGLFGTVGNTGAAHALLLLVAVLEQAKAGDRILVASYGDGCDALLLQVKQPPVKARAVSMHLAAKRTLASYDRFLLYRGIMETNPEQPSRVEPYAAATVTLRDQRYTLRLHAAKCNKCGTVTHPPQRVCYTCRAKDDFTEVRIADKPGSIFSYTRDNLAGGPEPPVVNCIVESDEGQCRLFCIMTDVDPMTVKIGARVEFTFRRMHEGGGFINYYWKVRPLLGG
ncbi:MAG: hydroxymethylglutaryl-CoA synthase family protein [Dehalococcoidia bacterium]|nr:hydroxymethylglutaryl-CoA synthase family protein [Dehalococcoidia bacterium]